MYHAADTRYDQMIYNRCGKSGLKLPAISLGLWHNFGHDTPHATKRALCQTAFDLGITHFDLANNYGPPYGSAEANAGRILREDFGGLRDELVVGDIASAEADAIVSSANYEMRMRTGVGDALRRAGGDELEALAMSEGERELGACVVTRAGRLRARHILHAVSA